MRWLTKLRFSYFDVLAIAATVQVVERHGVAWGVVTCVVLVAVSILAEMWVDR